MGADLDAEMREAVGDGCCPRHAAMGYRRGRGDSPCGPLTVEDLGTMTCVAEEGLEADDPGAYAKGALRAVLVLCATLAARPGAP